MVEGSSTAYLAVAGGFALPPFMGSLSTYARAGVGGFEGRKLAAGDALPLAREQAPPGDERKLGAAFDYGSGPIRIVWGPQEDYFTDEGRRTFVESDYRVSKEADRMGIRFEGPTIEHAMRSKRGRRHHLRRHRPRRHPGAGRRPADRAAGRPPDRRRLSRRSPPWPRSTCRGSAACCRARRCASAGPGRRGGEAAPRTGGADRARHRRFQGRPPAGRHRPRAALRGEPDRRRRLRETQA